MSIFAELLLLIMITFFKTLFSFFFKREPVPPQIQISSNSNVQPEPKPEPKPTPEPKPEPDPEPKPIPEPIPEPEPIITIKPKSEVVFSSELSDYKKNIVTKRTIEILGEAGYVSVNPKIEISSTIRTPREQAVAMYDNMMNGKDIAYAAPGKEVIAVYNANKTKPKEEVVSLMTKKIEELAVQNKRVSLHCVPENIYVNRNIVDVRTGIKNPRDFVKALIKYNEVTKIITPIAAYNTSPYNSSKVSVDTNEPAIHVEFQS